MGFGPVPQARGTSSEAPALKGLPWREVLQSRWPQPLPEWPTNTRPDSAMATGSSLGANRGRRRASSTTCCGGRFAVKEPIRTNRQKQTSSTVSVLPVQSYPDKPTKLSPSPDPALCCMDGVFFPQPLRRKQLWP